MSIVYRSCCGLDVHKKTITACAVYTDEKGKRRLERRVFGTFTQELIALAAWMHERGVYQVAMESTGVYWKPVWNILEGQFELLLVNAQHIKAVPGRKTDQKDSEWIAELLEHGLLKSSFVPPREIRQLRDLTRYRVTLAQECNRIANRIQKVLEDANLKLASVATDALGASGRAMLKAVITGEENPATLAEMSRGLLRRKKADLALALDGQVREHHRWLLAELMRHREFIEASRKRLDKEIAARVESFADAVRRLCRVPGIDRVTAWGLLAEIGLDMTQFPDAKHLASWAGLCPGNWESAGKRKSGRTRKGSLWLRRCLCQAAWGISTKQKNYLSALFRRLAARRGVKRATIAVAHALLVIAYHVLKGAEYSDLGADYFDRLNPQSARRRLVKRLEALGHKVILQPLALPS